MADGAEENVVEEIEAALKAVGPEAFLLYDCCADLFLVADVYGVGQEVIDELKLRGHEISYI